MAAALSDGFDDITKALDEIENRIAFVVDSGEIGNALLDAVALGHRVDGLTSRLALAAKSNGVLAGAGQRTAGQFVAARTNSSAAKVSQLATAGKWLKDFPVLEAAFGKELTQQHVSVLRTHLDGTYEMRAKLIDDQQFFVDCAATCSFAGFEEACQYWLVMIDPDGKEPTEQIEKSRFRVGHGQGGRGEITGVCDAVTAQAIRTAVDHEAEKIRRTDKQAGIERTEGQRKMAALHALVARGFARDDGTYPAALGNLVMSAKVAEWALDRLNGNNTDDTVPVHPTDIDGRCELIDGTPIHPFLALTALGLIGPTGTINKTILRRYVMEADSRLLDVSANARIFPEWMRTAAFVQSRGSCETLGCDAPHSWMQVDHVDPVDNGGETRFDQAQTQCRPDNQARGATTGLTAWRDRTPPPRRTHRLPRASTTNDDEDADSG